MRRSSTSRAAAALALAALAASSLGADPAPQAAPPSTEPEVTSLDYCDYVLPLVGTQGEGNVFPGAVAPFGMIQLSPDTEDSLWETASGYEYSDSSIIGFSLTHLSGTGIPDLGDILFQPMVGTPVYVPGSKANPDSGYRASYLHDTEEASPAYYRVTLAKSGVKVELTAADRAGILRFTFPATDSAFILTDLAHVLRWDVVWSNLRIENDSTVTGFHVVNGWAKERYIYFAAQYSRPFDDVQIMKDGKPVRYDGYRFRSRFEAAGKSLQLAARYRTSKAEEISVKVAISAVSTANARKNLEAEIPGWDFDAVRMATRAKWNKELGRIDVFGTKEEREAFYTSMYHAFLAPELFEDVNGQYRGLDQNVHGSKDFTNYAIFSLWDTYRATHPLFALIQAERDASMINAMLAHYDQSVEHLLPVWSLQGNETWCMIGYHAVPVIVDAFRKGVTGFDPERAYAAIRATALNPNYDEVATYAKLGWVPFDQENESVSKTLEYAYDDWCVAVMAKALGKVDDAATFAKRAGFYRNIFDPTAGLMRGKDSQGNWRTPFDPHGYVEGGDITEGTSWQYSWYVPHDVPGLIQLMGGKERFVNKLNSIFVTSAADTSKGVDDIEGRMGEYWHGNEPSHHIAYLYCYADAPWKTQELVRKIVATQYGNKPNSLCGNDDCGQVSAWHIFSVLGFYPVCPGADYYVIGSPSISRAVMHLSNGKTFTVKANGLSAENVYVQSVGLNGKAWMSPFLPFDAIKNGGMIEFTMGPQPNRSWGVGQTVPQEALGR